MKTTIVSIMAAMAIMASGAMAPSAHGWGKDKARTSDSGMYQSGSSSSSSDLNQGSTSDSGMHPSGAGSGSSTDLSKGTPSSSGTPQSGTYSSSSMSQGSGFQFSKFMDKEVKGMNGDKLGTVKDFVVDPNGHVFALISRDDMAGKTVAVPFEAFSSTGMTGMSQDDLSLNISKDQLANAPDFNQSSLADRTWSEGVYRHFGIQPRWSDQGMTGQSGTGTQGSSSYQGGSSQGSMSNPSGSSSDQGLKGTEQGTMGGQSSQPKTNY